MIYCLNRTAVFSPIQHVYAVYKHSINGLQHVCSCKQICIYKHYFQYFNSSCGHPLLMTAVLTENEWDKVLII